VVFNRERAQFRSINLISISSIQNLAIAKQVQVPSLDHEGHISKNIGNRTVRERITTHSNREGSKPTLPKWVSPSSSLAKASSRFLLDLLPDPEPVIEYQRCESLRKIQDLWPSSSWKPVKGYNLDSNVRTVAKYLQEHGARVK